MAAARECLGTPFHHQGRVPEHGLDCIGLLAVVVSRLGLRELARHDRTDYRRIPDGKELRGALEAVCDPIDEARPGDVLLFWIRRPGRPRHVAIATDRGIIHTWEGGPGRVVEHALSAWWRRRVVGSYRLRGVF